MLRPNRHLATVSLAGLLAGAALLGGCREKPVQTYKIKKEPEAAPAMPGADLANMSAPGLSAPANPGATWTAPATWQQQAGNSVRVGSYKVPGADGTSADFSITVFPGDVGGDLANANRWRNQIGLPPIGANELGTALTPFAASAGSFLVANFSNTAQPPQRVLAALFKQPDRTWFFKLAGPAGLVADEEANFRAFLQSVKFGAAETAPAAASSPPFARPAAAASTDAPLPAGHPPIGGGIAQPGGLPDGHPPVGGATMAVPTDGALPGGHPPIGGQPAPSANTANPAAPASSLTWAAPDNWIAKPLGAMRRGSFTVKNDAGDADCSIIVLGAAGNPLLDNVNRWRGQVGLAPLAAGELAGAVQKVSANGLEFAVVDLPGQAPGGGAATRIVGAIAYRGEEAWFVKLSGADAVVIAEKPAFVQFLHTVRPTAN